MDFDTWSEQQRQEWLEQVTYQEELIQPEKRYRLIRAIIYEGDGAWLKDTLSKSLPDQGSRKVGDCTITAYMLECKKL